MPSLLQQQMRGDILHVLDHIMKEAHEPLCLYGGLLSLPCIGAWQMSEMPEHQMQLSESTLTS